MEDLAPIRNPESAPDFEVNEWCVTFSFQCRTEIRWRFWVVIFVIFPTLPCVETFCKLLNVRIFSFSHKLILTTTKNKTYHICMTTTTFVNHFSFRLTSESEFAIGCSRDTLLCEHNFLYFTNLVRYPSSCFNVKSSLIRWKTFRHILSRCINHASK